MNHLAKQALDALGEIYETKAHGQYGLSQVTQRAHALQSAMLARQRGLPSHLVVACLLHDIGHMIHQLGAHPAAEGVDDFHEELGANWLGQFFGKSVTEPVRLHVHAKRFLCATEQHYLSGLSEDSIESLILQGGPMSDTEIAAFKMTERWHDAVSLRRIDEVAKQRGVVTPEFIDFSGDIIACVELGS
jgi:[1-hydroxy-2-(trimethylamino)ethyl]phosphonate dioxygenase